ncbi:MAG: RidA family protein [Verrucomicrobiales bacterium]|nr:RidA family protein [Verrucomicrobiales bacterium]
MRSIFVFLLASPLLWTTPLRAEELSYSHFEGSQETASVSVKRGGLVHTRLFNAAPMDSKERAVADLVGQIAGVARAFDSSIEMVAKLNLYSASSDSNDQAGIRKAIASHWPAGKQPAITLIPSAIPGDALLAGDAVIAVPSQSSEVEIFERDAALMPATRDIIYVSGRAASGELAPATAGTMTQLFDVLGHLGSNPKDVVQVKAFIQPIDKWEIVEAEIEKSFGGNPPPVVYVEWISSSRSTEIELIAAAPDQLGDKGTISYFTPPEDKRSPVYSRVARVHSDRVIYLSGHHGAGSESDAKALYAQLKRTATAAGTDLRHFAKATYYVTTPEASASLNTVRPRHYDPERPPAASKVMIRSLDQEYTQLLIDMVAAPVEQ